jgi:hypothetical protein
MTDTIHTNSGQLKHGHLLKRLGRHYMVESVEAIERFIEPTCEECGSVRKQNGNKAVLEFVEHYVLVEISEENLAIMERQEITATLMKDRHNEKVLDDG